MLRVFVNHANMRGGTPAIVIDDGETETLCTRLVLPPESVIVQYPKDEPYISSEMKGIINIAIEIPDGILEYYV